MSANPGSDEAIKQGCLCPVIDNHRGYGYMGQKDIFIMDTSCPLHNGVKVELGERSYNFTKDATYRTPPADKERDL